MSTSTGVGLSKKDSCGWRVGVEDGTGGLDDTLSARLSALACDLDDLDTAGGLQSGGVCGMTSLEDAGLDVDAREVLMFRSARPRVLRRALSVECMLVGLGVPRGPGNCRQRVRSELGSGSSRSLRSAARPALRKLTIIDSHGRSGSLRLGGIATRQAISSRAGERSTIWHKIVSGGPHGSRTEVTGL